MLEKSVGKASTIWCQENSQLEGREERYANRDENRVHVIDRLPLVLENVEAQGSIAINVGVEHFRGEANFGRFVGVFIAEFQLHGEDTTYIGRNVVRDCEGISQSSIAVAILYCINVSV